MEFPRRQFCMQVMAVFMAFCGLLAAAQSVQAAESVPRILVLNSYNTGYDWWEEEMAGFRETIAATYPRIDLYVEHLDTKKFHHKKHFPTEASLLQAKYSNLKLDVIVAMDNAALEFAIKYRKLISPDTPLVFCGINDFEPKMIAGQVRITGVAEYHDFVGTLGLALQLHPSARDVIVVHDYTDTGMAIRNEVEKMALRYPALKLHFMEEMPLEETVKKLKSIKHEQLVLMLSYTVEKGGRTFSHAEAARMVSGNSPVPVYSVYAAQLGSGVIGGRMMKGQIQGQKAAELVLQIISGKSPDNLPVITSDLSSPMFDYKAMSRFGMTNAKLPADTFVINSPSSTFAVDKNTLWLGGVIFLLCATGLVLTTLNIRKRLQLEESLRQKINQYQESQEELQAVEEMLRAQVDDYMQSQDELQATEEMLREQIAEYQNTHDQLLATEEMLRVQLEAVEESSQKFKAVFEHSPLTVALTTLPDGTFSEVNQAFIDMFGYTSEEAIGKSTLQLGVWQHESDRDCYLKMLKENGYVHNFETQMRRKNGELFSVFFSGAMLEIGGRPFALSVVMDVSEQKRLQNQLSQSQKMDVVGQLAGGIAHDFNNMLGGIMAAAELLKLRLPGDERNSRLIETIIEATGRSADLTRELLTFSRKGTAVARPINIDDAILAVMSLLERTIDKKVELTKKLAAENPVVVGDQTQLQNALLNLGINARDAMPHGGVLTYATAVKRPDDAACRSLGVSLAPGNYLEITVSDTGIGMTKAVMDHIFEPFFTTKAVGKGTGLGLSAVYGIVRSHQGELYVQSEPGVGSVFKIYLPLIDEAAIDAVRDDGVIAGKGGILLVDDEEILREVGRDLLEDLGYTVYLAEDGVEALEVYSKHREKISLVVLDMMMPKMNGRETFIQLHSIEPELKVLFCSGFHREGTEDELQQIGACGFLRKPYNRSELSRAVAEALEQ